MIYAWVILRNADTIVHELWRLGWLGDNDDVFYFHIQCMLPLLTGACCRLDHVCLVSAQPQNGYIHLRVDDDRLPFTVQSAMWTREQSFRHPSDADLERSGPFDTGPAFLFF